MGLSVYFCESKYLPLKSTLDSCLIMGVGSSAILGSTNKFFMPWLVPRNDKSTVWAPTILGKLVNSGANGRKRRDITNHEITEDVMTYLNEVTDAFYGCKRGDWECMEKAAMTIYQTPESKKYERQF